LTGRGDRAQDLATGTILVVPVSRDGLGPFYENVIAVNPLQPRDPPRSG
jgi:hypothetical protein